MSRSDKARSEKTTGDVDESSRVEHPAGAEQSPVTDPNPTGLTLPSSGVDGDGGEPPSQADSQAMTDEPGLIRGDGGAQVTQTEPEPSRAEREGAPAHPMAGLPVTDQAARERENMPQTPLPGHDAPRSGPDIAEAGSNS